MTLEELNEHLSLVRELIEARELLEALKTSPLHASCFDGVIRSPYTISDGHKASLSDAQSWRMI